MSVPLRVVLVVVSVAFLVFVLRMVRNDKFLLKYAILWVVLGVLGVLLAVFPGAAFWLSSMLGFETPVNFVFMVTIVLLMGISLVYGAALSKQAAHEKSLIQEVSMLKARLAKLDGITSADLIKDDTERAGKNEER